MAWPLFERLPTVAEAESQTLDRFLEYVADARLELYPAQEEAILELYGGKNVILNTPTGSGKSLVAAALHFHALAHGKRSIYTCPIKALVNEKFLALCRDFGPEQVGMITGDASVNPGAPILCCTAEILSNDALRLGRRAPFDDVIMDEFHYYSDRERGVAWQIPLLTMPQSRFLLMSATIGDPSPFETALTRLNQRETVVVRSAERPVPLDYEYGETPLHETVARLIASGKTPIYLVQFTQRECAEEAQNFMSLDFCTKEEKKTIAEALEGTKFTSPYGKEIQKFLKHGLGLHHGGLLPKYRILVEKLAQRGLLKIIFGTDTLGVGVNIPIRTVLFTKLCKYDGEKTTILSVRDFQQISGRAGRRGFDTQGTVVVQAPEHIIENLRQESKAAGDAKKLKKLVKKKPPEKGYLPWTRETFDKLVKGMPEPLISRFQVSHAMLLNVLGRQLDDDGSDGRRAMQRIIRDCHETEVTRKRLGRTAFQLFRSLVDRKIIEFKPLRINIDLQQDFSLNHTLSLYLLDAIQALDPEHEDYAVDLLTLVESILEDPDLILRKQLDRLKTIKMGELKMQGLDFDDRIAELEKLEYPKPNRDFIYETFNTFSAAHPWVGQENIRPKSIARELFETFQSFTEYIRDYDLQRAEGILLRYLSQVYKVLVQTVPAAARTEEVEAIIDYLGTMIRSIDSSLLDEWEQLRNPLYVPAASNADAEALAEAAARAADVTRDKRAFTIQVRNEVFRFVRALASGDYEAAVAQVQTADTPDSLKARLAPFYSEHARILTDTKARNPQHTSISPDETGAAWVVQQMLRDAEEHNDWVVEFRVELAASREASRPVLTLVGIRQI
ncbi:MAG: DUF3516 domain-containing protein [Deltaproteobacteria bacterium]|nr:DUF3516 domain-containing protein [Deltaproteobacteria bacterium]